MPFCDEFHVLHASVPLQLYEEIRANVDRSHFAKIARSITEVGPYIRFVVVDLQLINPMTVEVLQDSVELQDKEIYKLVYQYIGVSQGYLGDFSYSSHHEFYLELDLDINPYDYEGTTRERFSNILQTSPTMVQAKILEGILERYPIESSELRTQERYEEIKTWILRLKGLGAIDIPAPRVTSDIVYRALEDAEKLINSFLA